MAAVPLDPGSTTPSYGWVPNDAASLDNCTPGAQNQCFCVYATLETDPVTYFAASHKGTKELLLADKPGATEQDCW